MVTKVVYTIKNTWLRTGRKKADRTIYIKTWHQKTYTSNKHGKY